MAAEIPVLPELPLSSETFVASLPVVLIQELPYDERVCNICTLPYRVSTVGFTAINVSSENAVRLACGHVFGQQCITTWLAIGTTCPFCRRQLFERYISQDSMRRSWHDHTHDPLDLLRNAISSLDPARSTIVRRPVEETIILRVRERLRRPALTDETIISSVRERLRRPSMTRRLEALAARAYDRNDSRVFEPSATEQEIERAVQGPQRSNVIPSMPREFQDRRGAASTQTAAVTPPRERWSSELQIPAYEAERTVQMTAAPRQERVEARSIERPREEQGSGPTQGIAAARGTSRAAAPLRRPRTEAEFDVTSARVSPTIAAVAAQENRIVPVATSRTKTSVALIGRSRRVTRDSESHNISTRASSRTVRLAAQGSSRGPAANPRVVGRPFTRSMSRGIDLNPGL